MNAFNRSSRSNLDYVMLSSLLNHRHAATMGHDVLLNDNLTDCIDLNSESQLTDGSPKRIDFATIIICTQGRMTMRLNLTDYDVQQDDVLLCAPGTIGESVLTSPDCRLCLIAFSERVYNESAKDRMSQLLRNYILRNPVKIHLGNDHQQMATTCYRLMWQVLSNPEFRYQEESVRANVSALSAILVQDIELAETMQTERTRQEILFDRFLQEVREGYGTSRMVSFYADRLCVSPKYLSHVVKDVSGRQPTDWIRDYVILNAKALLRTGNHSVQQVADLLAFPNASFFGKYFREHVGCTPREYQNKKL